IAHSVGSYPNQGRPASRHARFPAVLPQTDLGDTGHMEEIGAAAAAVHPQPRQQLLQAAVVIGKLLRIASVQGFGGVQLGVAAPGSIAPHTANALAPSAVSPQALLEVAGVGTVDHIVKGVAATAVVNPGNGIPRLSPVGRWPSVSTVKEITTGRS